MLLKKEEEEERKKMKDFLSQEQAADIFQVGKGKKWRGKLTGTYSPVMNQKTAENLGITNMIRCFLSQM